MAVTSGFFPSKDGDRKYNSLQMGSIFDGIINDGIYAQIGDHLAVSADDSGMVVYVGTGRAWFNHSWTLNDAVLPLDVSDAHGAYSRIDAVVLEVNRTPAVRQNSIKIIKGEPSKYPVKPKLESAMVNLRQYPLAYVTVESGTTKIRQANIENRIGLDETPYVTGPLELFDATELSAQWKDQWDQWLNNTNNTWLDRLAEINAEWSAHFEAIKQEWTEWFEITKQDWAEWFGSIKVYWTTFLRSKVDEWSSFRINTENEFTEWWNNMKFIMDEDVAGNVLNKISELTMKVDDMEAQFDRIRITAERVGIWDELNDSEGRRIYGDNNADVDTEVVYYSTAPSRE